MGYPRLSRTRTSPRLDVPTHPAARLIPPARPPPAAALDSGVPRTWSRHEDLRYAADRARVPAARRSRSASSHDCGGRPSRATVPSRIGRLPAKLVTAKCTTVPVWSSRSDSGARRAARCARSRRRRQRPRPRHLSIPMGRYATGVPGSAPISARESKCARQGVIWAQRPSFGYAPAWARPCP